MLSLSLLVPLVLVTAVIAETDLPLVFPPPLPLQPPSAVGTVSFRAELWRIKDKSSKCWSLRTRWRQCLADRRVWLGHLFGETLNVKLAHGVTMGSACTNRDPDLDPRLNKHFQAESPWTDFDLGQRLNKLIFLIFSFPSGKRRY